jgi:hypothetical protein
MPRVHKLLYPASAHGHERKLGGDKKSVDQDEDNDGQQFAGCDETAWIVHTL